MLLWVANLNWAGGEAVVVISPVKKVRRLIVNVNRMGLR